MASASTPFSLTLSDDIHLFEAGLVPVGEVLQEPGPSTTLSAYETSLRTSPKDLEEVDVSQQSLQDISFSDICGLLGISNDDDLIAEQLDVHDLNNNLFQEEENKTEDEEFLGFTHKEITFSRMRSSIFSFFYNDWMNHFNVKTLWAGRDFVNLQFSLDVNNKYGQDNNISLEFDLKPQFIEDPQTLSYSLIENSSQRGHDQLFDSNSFTYNFKHQTYVTLNKEVWRCAQGDYSCEAEIVIFNKGQANESVEFMGNHEHEPRYTLDELFFMRSLKQEAIKDMYAPATQIVNRLLAERNIFANKYSQLAQIGLLSYNKMKNMVYRIRRKFCPPKEYRLIFDLNVDVLAHGFLKKDIITDNQQRFIIFATDEQLDYMFNANVWYIDGTFAIVRKTAFMQLLVFHVMIGTNFNFKSIPCMYIFMSTRTKCAYMEVFTEVLNLFVSVKGLAPYVERLMIDFEIALWQALRDLKENGIFASPNLKITGCIFHFTQAIFRKLNFFHLKSSYRFNPDTKFLLRLFMALPLLPEHMILRQYLRLRRKCFAYKGKIGTLLQHFSNYFRKTWMTGNWGPHDWCQFEEIHRTNNISESHNGAFKKRLFYGDMTFYSVVDKLFLESQNLGATLSQVYSLEARTVSRKVLRSESYLMFLWDKLKAKEIKPEIFLQTATHLKLLDVNEKWAFEESRSHLE